VYLRHSTVRKDGKTHTYWRLVRSVRRGGKVSQQTVAQLGELDAQGRARAQALARQITGRAEQYELFEDRTPGSTSVEVRLDRVRLERSRNFGDVWLGWTLWRALELDQWCDELMLVGREQIFPAFRLLPRRPDRRLPKTRRAERDSRPALRWWVARLDYRYELMPNWRWISMSISRYESSRS